MFGIDWDGDGEESLADDMITMDVIDDFGMDDATGASSGSSGGGCLGAIIGIIVLAVLFLLMIFVCGGILL